MVKLSIHSNSTVNLNQFIPRAFYFLNRDIDFLLYHHFSAIRLFLLYHNDLNTYRISLESATPPKNKERGLLDSPKYPRKIDEK